MLTRKVIYLTLIISALIISCAIQIYSFKAVYPSIQYQPELAGNYINYMDFKKIMIYDGDTQITPYTTTNTIDSIKQLSLLKHDRDINFGGNYTVKIFPYDYGEVLDLSITELWVMIFAIIFLEMGMLLVINWKDEPLINLNDCYINTMFLFLGYIVVKLIILMYGYDRIYILKIVKFYGFPLNPLSGDSS